MLSPARIDQQSDATARFRLPDGCWFVVDSRFAEIVASHRWFIEKPHGRSRGGYVIGHPTTHRKRGRPRRGEIIEQPQPRNLVRLHRLVMGVTIGDGTRVDHINGDKLDNRRCNLRLATNAENMHNRGPQTNNTSGHKGVYFCKQTGRWCAQIFARGRHITIGRFDSIEDAAAAQRAAAEQIAGEFSGHLGASPRVLAR